MPVAAEVPVMVKVVWPYCVEGGIGASGGKKMSSFAWPGLVAALVGAGLPALARGSIGGRSASSGRGASASRSSLAWTS